MTEEKQRQAQIVRRQDEHMEGISDSLERLHSVGLNIRSELEEQAVMIDDLHTEVDKAQSSLDRAMGMMQKILKTKDNCQLGTILMLTLVLIGLGVVVLT
jgi:hypothetical protein